MQPSNFKPTLTGTLFAMPGAAVGLLVAFVLLAAAPAFAAYQQVGTFGGSFTVPVPPEKFPEQDELGGVSSMAVNEDGAGGVPAGTVYAIGSGNPLFEIWKVARFSPTGEFQLAWTFSKRCGPEVPPEPPATQYPACETLQQGTNFNAVAVDQATGDVYVYDPQEGHVRVYAPDGAKLIAQFGERAAPGETTAASPEKFHGTAGSTGMTVDDSGNVYVTDVNTLDNFRNRLMVFQPQAPGDYEHYAYAGESHDIGNHSPSLQTFHFPSLPVVDGHGDVYVAGPGYIEEFEPSHPTTPICTFALSDAALSAMTVDPENGEVFYYDSKTRKVQQLHSCNGEGKFVEVEGGAFSVSPQRGNINALVFNPALQYEPSRAAGVLYAATPDPVPGTGGGGEPSHSALGYIFAPPVKHEPVVEAEEVSKVSSASALLGAEVNPKGANTHYYFQYLTAAAYEANEPSERFAGASEAPVGGAPLGGGSTGVAVSATATTLSPETEYYYRVVAISGEGTADGSAMSFRTFPIQAAGLPDGRAYELVSPIEKHGGEVFPANPQISSCVDCKPGLISTRFPHQSAPDGEGVTYDGSAFGSAGSVNLNEYLAKRTATGWQTTALTPTRQTSSSVYPESVAFDPDLDRAVVYQDLFGLTPQAPAEYANLYSQPTSDPLALSALLVEAPPDRSTGNVNRLHLTYAGASADLSRIFFSANDALTGEMPPFAPAAVDGGESKHNLYEWSEGRLRLVNVDPGNASTTPGAAYGARSKNQVYVRDDVAHAVSEDGSRVFWSSEAGQVYVRENRERTVEIPDHSGEFLAAAADGSRVLLTDGHIYGDLEAQAPVQEADLSGGQGGFQGLAGQSEDLSRVYFVDTAVLDETANAQGAKAQTGRDNLYAWHEGTRVFIATLLEADDSAGTIHAFGDWVAAPEQRSAEASPDGRWVAFLSEAELTGRGNVGSCTRTLNKKDEYEEAPGPCREVFIYDSVSGKLACASCNPTGARPVGNSFLPSINAEEWISQPRYLSDSGRLLFDSRDSLSPADTNNGVEDVYEYEPAGIGSCMRTGGCASLISGGSGATDSNFLAMDPSGKNVFFTTRDQLVRSDRDQLIDLYDAREGGGFATESEPAPQGCRGEACQQQSSSTPSALVEPVPGSFTFVGSRNMIQPLPSAPVKPRAKALSRAQQRARALKACRKKPRKARASCEKSVRRQYAAKARARKTVTDRKRSK
jgi:hypothetical protein